MFKLLKPLIYFFFSFLKIDTSPSHLLIKNLMNFLQAIMEINIRKFEETNLKQSEIMIYALKTNSSNFRDYV